MPAFLEAGVKGIALLATNAEKLAETERSIKTANPDVETVTCALDISNIKGVGSAFAAIKAKFGHADFLVHAAGAAFNDGPKLHETDQEEWWRNFVSKKGNSQFTATDGLGIGSQWQRRLPVGACLPSPTAGHACAGDHRSRELVASLLYYTPNERVYDVKIHCRQSRDVRRGRVSQCDGGSGASGPRSNRFIARALPYPLRSYQHRARGRNDGLAMS